MGTARQAFSPPSLPPILSPPSPRRPRPLPPPPSWPPQQPTWRGWDTAITPTTGLWQANPLPLLSPLAVVLHLAGGERRQPPPEPPQKKNARQRNTIPQRGGVSGPRGGPARTHACQLTAARRLAGATTPPPTPEGCTAHVRSGRWSGATARRVGVPFPAWEGRQTPRRAPAPPLAGAPHPFPPPERASPPPREREPPPPLGIARSPQA